MAVFRRLSCLRRHLERSRALRSCSALLHSDHLPASIQFSLRRFYFVSEMAVSLIARRHARQFVSVVQARCYGGHGSDSGLPLPLQKVDIGKREIVGYGVNGELTYIDSVMHPFPAIRFKEDAGDISALREKEKGDWKKLTLEEKKSLYRASFCQTLAEVEAPTGEWKSILGIVLIGLSLGFWGFLFIAFNAYAPLPDTLVDEEKMKAQIDRMVALRVNPVEGLTSNYDYEKGEWKK